MTCPAHAPSGPLVTRRRLQIALGLVWLFDGTLQCQPSMFSADFFGMMLRMGRAAPPSWLWDLGSRVEPSLTAHAAAANAVFASLQLLIGAGLLWRRTVRPALALSVPWAVAVWLFGEAAGGIFVQGANAMTGAPGAALVYVVMALLLWPRRDDDGMSAGESGLLPRPLPELTWVALWVGTAALEAESLNRLPGYVGGAVDNAAQGGPAWLTTIDHGVGGLVGVHGTLFAVCAGAVQAAVGVGFLVPRLRRASLAAGMALAAFYGLVGQGVGGIFDHGLGGLWASGATDPGTGPVIILLALSLWPRRAARAARAPGGAVTFAYAAAPVLVGRERERPSHTNAAMATARYSR